MMRSPGIGDLMLLHGKTAGLSSLILKTPCLHIHISLLQVARD